MYVLKKIIFGIIAFFAITIVASFFVPDQFTVKRSMYIDAPIENVFEEVNDLRNWEDWSYWHSLDTSWELQYQHRFEGEGAGFVWDSKTTEIGNGILEIVRSRENEEVVVNVQFDSREDATIWYLFQKQDRGTKVTTMIDVDTGLDPFAKLSGVQTKWRMGRAFDYGLIHLKDIAEANEFTRQN